MVKIIPVMVLLTICAVSSAYGGNCEKLKYINTSQLDSDVLEMHHISARVFPKWVKTGDPIYGICFGLFKEGSKKTVLSGEVDEKGGFDVRNLRDGSYRLVVVEIYTKDLYNISAAANIRVKINRENKEDKKLMVYLISGGMHSGSYGELQ
jgi:hypothetical protein